MSGYSGVILGGPARVHAIREQVGWELLSA
jgi:hypothetical protein